MQQCPVPNGHILADMQGKAARVVGAIMRDVQDRSVLNVGAGTDADNLNVTTHRCVRPHAHIIAE